MASAATLASVAVAIAGSAALPGCGSDPPPPQHGPSSSEPSDPDASAAIDTDSSDTDPAVTSGRDDDTPAEVGSVASGSESTESEQSEEDVKQPGPAEHDENVSDTDTQTDASTSDAQAPAEPESEGVEPPDPADDVSAPDTSGSEVAHLTYELFGGGAQTLGRYHGRPLVVNFFSSTCPPCIVEMPDFQRVYERLGNEVAFLGLSVDPDPDDSQWVIEQTAVTYDLGSDADSDVFRALDGLAMPTSVFISRDGSVSERFSGRLTESDLLARIDKIRAWP